MHAEAEFDVDIDLVSLWHELARDPDCPDRFEITQHGEIVVSPSPTSRHQTIISYVTEQIREQLGGRALQEVSMLTRSAGIRRPDAIWLPDERIKESLVDGPMETVPPLVVEVLSPGNRKPEISHKIRAYLETGVEEVVVIGRTGSAVFHRADGPHETSTLGLRLALPAELFI
jgi:Uma2 family endonuclease